MSNSGHPINRLLRESRSAPTFPASAGSDQINRALRAAAGFADDDEPDQQQPTPTLPKLGGSDYLLAREEPPPGADLDAWERWIFKGRVVRLLDQAGKLLGEPGYDRNRTGPADPAAFDLSAAVKARRQRWRNLTGI